MQRAKFPNLIFGAGLRSENAALLLMLTILFLLFLILLVAVPAARAQYQVIYRFTGGLDGQSPMSAVTMDRAGNIYGTAAGDQNGGTDSVFKLAPSRLLKNSYFA